MAVVWKQRINVGCVQAALKMQKKASDYAVGIVKLFEMFVEVMELVKVRAKPRDRPAWESDCLCKAMYSEQESLIPDYVRELYKASKTIHKAALELESSVESRVTGPSPV